MTENGICSAASYGSAALREGSLLGSGQEVNAGYLYAPLREKAIGENPQIFPNCKL